MRGIYYTYMMRLLGNMVLLHGFSLLILLILLTQYVSIGNVINNMMQIQIGALGTFFYNALSNTEAWTLVIIGGIILASFSLRFNLSRFKQITPEDQPEFA